MGVLFTVPFVILDETTAEGRYELSEIPDFHPGLASELLAVVDSEDDGRLDTMAAQPRDDPEIPAQTIVPRLLSGVGDELETGVDVQSAPLVVRYPTLVKVQNLFTAKGLAVSDLLQVDLHNLAGLG
jgi:hypothetical protein